MCMYILQVYIYIYLYLIIYIWVISYMYGYIYTYILPGAMQPILYKENLEGVVQRDTMLVDISVPRNIDDKVCCRVIQSVAVLQCVAVCCSMLQCVAECSRVLQQRM